jgi:hypothetical protein
MATGANANTWGTNTNNNLDVIDAFSAGYLSKSVAGSSNITLTTANASDTAEASNKVIELTGALTGDIVVFIPAVESNYTFFNNTTGSQTLTIAATGHTANGTLITQGAHTTVYCDGSSNFNVEIASSTDAAALNKGTLPDARFPATLPAVSGANLTNLDAADLASGTIPDARFPATLPALNGSALTNLDADNLASGTVADARLPTIGTDKGGTGLTSLGTAGQVLTVTAPGTAVAFADAAGGGIGNNTVTTFTNPGTFTADSDSQFIAVSVVGGGGGGAGGIVDSSTNQAGNSGTSGTGSSFGNLLSTNGGSGGNGSTNMIGGNGGGGSASGNVVGIASDGESGSSGTGGHGGLNTGNAGKGGNGGQSSIGNRVPNSRGGGGGGGGFAYAVLGTPSYSPTTPVSIGNAGNGGNNVTSGPNGSAGNKGEVKITEFIT